MEGEHTLYPYLFELIDYIKIHDLKCTLVTNGCLFSDIKYVKKIEQSGLDLVGFSIKAANAKQQIELTKIDAFEKIKQAIKNLSAMLYDFAAGKIIASEVGAKVSHFSY